MSNVKLQPSQQTSIPKIEIVPQLNVNFLQMQLLVERIQNFFFEYIYSIVHSSYEQKYPEFGHKVLERFNGEWTSQRIPGWIQRAIENPREIGTLEFAIKLEVDREINRMWKQDYPNQKKKVPVFFAVVAALGILGLYRIAR